MEYKQLTTVEKIKFAREGSAVERTHVMQKIGSYPVGQHSFNMLAMLRILHPAPTMRLVWAILEHDIPERVMGDMPSPAKWAGVIDRDKESFIETLINNRVFGCEATNSLTDSEHNWLKGLDILEFYCWCRDQMMMGNMMVRTTAKRTSNFLKANAASFPVEIMDAYYEIKMDGWETMPELGENV